MTDFRGLPIEYGMTDLLTTHNLTSYDTLTFWVAFNKTLRAREASRANKVDKVFQQVQAQQAGAGGPVQANCTV